MVNQEALLTLTDTQVHKCEDIHNSIEVKASKNHWQIACNLPNLEGFYCQQFAA